jgi:hypothetical protein
MFYLRYICLFGSSLPPPVCMLHCSDDLLSIWIVLLVLSQCNIQTRRENKKNNPDTK